MKDLNKKDDTTFQDLIKDEFSVENKLKHSNEKKNWKFRNPNERASEIMQELAERSLIGQKKDDNKVATMLKEIDIERDEKAVAALETVRLKDKMERSTEKLLNDLIKDTLSQQQKHKKGTEDKMQHKKETTGVEDLEASLLDLLLKERSKDAK